MLNLVKKYLSENTGILIRLDDIAENMNWPLMKKCETLFDKYNIKPLLGVISNNKDSNLLSYPKNDSFWNQVRTWKEKKWEITMHGYTHVYDTETYKKDYFNYGGKSEFFGHTYEEQSSRIKKSLDIFNKQNIKIRSFFAPNHTYDLNTLSALQDNKIINIIDGYGLMPFKRNNMNFIPQLFYKEIALPFGIQSTQVHLNYWNEEDFLRFEKFIIKNNSKIISFDDAIKKVNVNKFYLTINWIIEKSLKLIRKF
jgi:predicted deacetylase